MDEEQKKISLPEAIIMIMVTGLADLFELVATFIEAVPVIGQIFLFIKCRTINLFIFRHLIYILFCQCNFLYFKLKIMIKLND